MRTLQEKYNAILEGKFSKEQFVVEARMQHPNLITRFNGYNDAAKILKNRGMISENFSEYSNDALSDMIINLSRFEGNEELIQHVKQELEKRKPVQEARLTEARGYSFTFNYNTDADDVEYIQRVLDNAGADAIAKAGTFDDEMIVRAFDATGLRRARKAIEADGFEINQNINEARLTKNNLTDYRYKPTNEMDKYPYEQILRGLRVELETMGVQGTPTAEEYAKALAKVSKNLAKDSIYYTNQLAGVNPKVDQHDQMVDATAKNTVDTFNGMKKVKNLKEDHTKNPNDKYIVKFSKANNTYQVWEGDYLVTDFATREKAKAYADRENRKQGLTESVLKEGIKNLIKKALMENEEDIYEMQGPKEDSEYKSELADYLEDNQIYGYTDRIHNIMTGPDEDEAYRELAEYLDSEGIYGYTRAIERIYSDYPYDQHWMNQPDEEDDLFESVSLKDLL